MTSELKRELLNYLQNISYAFDEGEGEFWKEWSAMHKFISDIETED